MPKEADRRLGRPPNQDSAETRQRIVREARACFARYGYGNTSNKMIARATGLTPAAIYYHFENKRELFLAVHQETTEFVLDRFTAALVHEESFAGKITALLDASIKLQREDPAMASFFTIDRAEAHRQPELTVILEDHRWPDLYAELVRFGVATGEIRPEDASRVRGVLAAVLAGLSQLASEVRVEVHGEIARGLQALFNGSLIKPLAVQPLATSPTSAGG